jgi:hypothetical protein
MGKSTRSKKGGSIPTFGTNMVIDPKCKGGERYSEMIQLVVGKGEKQRWYAVWRGMLVDNIAFFDRCLSIGMAEAETGVVHLPDDDPQSWYELLHFMENGTMSFHIDAILKTNAGNGALFADDEEAAKLELTLQVYLLAEKRGFEKLQNFCIDRIRYSLQHLSLGTQLMLLIFENTPDDDPMRKVLVRNLSQYIWQQGWPTFKQKHKHTWDNVFLRHPSWMEQLMQATYEDVRKTRVWNANRCELHVHRDGKSCTG